MLRESHSGAGARSCSLEGAGFITALAGLVVPFCGVLALLTYEPAVAQRGTDLLADACVRAYRSKLVRAVCAVALVAAVAAILHELLRPMALDVQALEYASPESTRYPLPTVPIVIEYPPQDEPQRERPSLPELDAHARFWITRIQLSAVPGRGLQRVGRALDERIGPVKWTSSPSFTPRLVTATGHFPPTVYQPRYRERLQAFEACKDEVRSDERFIEEWSTSVAGLLTPAEISWTQSVFRQGGFAILRRYERKPVDFCVLENVEEVRKLQELRASREKCLLLPAWKRGTADLLEPGEWQTLAGLLGRREFAVLLRTCDALFMNNLRRSDAPDAPAWARAPVYAKCNDPNPGSEEEFSRVVLQWQCERSRCRWSSIDMAAWQRISSVPCRTTGTSACLEEAFEYLASGRRGSRQ